MNKNHIGDSRLARLMECGEPQWPFGVIARLIPAASQGAQERPSRITWSGASRAPCKLHVLVYCYIGNWSGFRIHVPKGVKELGCSASGFSTQKEEG
jgi:hypothetical protein